MPRAQSASVLRGPDCPEVDAALEGVMASNQTARWAVTHGMYAMGVDSPRKFLAAYLDYSLADGIAGRITAPVLVGDAE